MKPTELKKLIKEEVHSALNEDKKYLNDMSYEELLALRKRMDFKKASREEKKYVKDLIDKKKPLSEDMDELVNPLETAINDVVDDAFKVARSREDLEENIQAISGVIGTLIRDAIIRNDKNSTLTEE